jgi:ferredoxin
VEAANAAAGRKVKKVVQKGADGTVIDTRFFEVSLDRPTGIEFATDLSLKYVYVMEVKDNSPAQLSVTPVEEGDQLVGINGEECIGQAFGDVAELLGKKPSEPLNFRFFRGSKQELLDATGRKDFVPTTAKVKAFEPDGTESRFEVAAGANLRDSMIKNKVQVYNVQSGRYTNCNGRQLCGTCIVKVLEGAEYTNSKSIDEANYLAKLPGNYRLSCCVNAYGDIIVETRPPTGKKLIEFL